MLTAHLLPPMSEINRKVWNWNTQDRILSLNYVTLKELWSWNTKNLKTQPILYQKTLACYQEYTPSCKGRWHIHTTTQPHNHNHTNCHSSSHLHCHYHQLLHLHITGRTLEVAIGCTVNCRASVIIYRVLEFMAIINCHLCRIPI